MGSLTGISLFSGIGGIDLGLRLAWPDYRTVCYVERDTYCQQVLQARIRDGYLDDAPIWDDVTTFDGRPWSGRVDCIAGGVPCQDLSCAGKRAGLEGERSGLWWEFARIIGEVGPRLALLENVPGIRRYLRPIVSELRRLGYAVPGKAVAAAAVLGAGHIRRRAFILAVRCDCSPIPANTNTYDQWGEQRRKQRQNRGIQAERVSDTQRLSWRTMPSRLLRLADGCPNRLDRLRALGNAVVPAVVRAFLRSIGA